MKIITLLHKLGHKILEYDVTLQGVIIDEREYSKRQYILKPIDDVIVWLTNDTTLSDNSKLKNEEQ